MNYKVWLLIAIIAFAMIFGSLNTTFIAIGSSEVTCEQCGMTLDSTAQARYRIVDSSGSLHYSCCPICAFKLIPKYGELNITAFCDYNGPNYPITIIARQNGSSLKLYPQTALVLLGGGCIKNRMVYDSAAADALLASPNNGTSRWLPTMCNVIVLLNATRTPVAKAVLQNAGGVTSSCEQCGMTVDVTGQQRFRIFDATGTVHVACCPICALRLQRTYNNLNITSFCDYYGPNYPITIVSSNNGTDITVTPSSVLIIAGGSCTKNRIVYNSTAADLLLASPNNGTSRYLSPMQNDTVAANSTRYTIAQAALINGAGVPSPTPTPTPNPTPLPSQSPTQPPTSILTPTNTPQTSSGPTQSPQPTDTESPNTSPSPTTQPTESPLQTEIPTSTPPLTTSDVLQCEVCGMDVTAESQARYVATDGNGNVHYVECFMCALQLIKDYPTLQIRTFCDWYGPSYPITVDSNNYGANVVVTPPTAMYLRGGSCVTARAAYNQTAADNLLTNGYSQYTSLEQQYALPLTTQVKTVTEAINAWYVQPKTTETPTNLMLGIVAGVGILVVAVSVVAYKKIKH